MKKILIAIALLSACGSPSPDLSGTYKLNQIDSSLTCNQDDVDVINSHYGNIYFSASQIVLVRQDDDSYVGNIESMEIDFVDQGETLSGNHSEDHEFIDGSDGKDTLNLSISDSVLTVQETYTIKGDDLTHCSTTVIFSME